jgi:hypothetical protein
MLEPPRRVSQQPGPYPGAFHWMFIEYGPHLSASDVMKHGKVMRREYMGGKVISLSSSLSPKDPNLGGVHPPPHFTALFGSAPGLFSLSLPEHTFSCWRHTSPPALPHPQAGRDLMVCYSHPNDPAQGREHDENKESCKPPKLDQA